MKTSINKTIRDLRLAREQQFGGKADKAMVDAIVLLEEIKRTASDIKNAKGTISDEFIESISNGTFSENPILNASVFA